MKAAVCSSSSDEQPLAFSSFAISSGVASVWWRSWAGDKDMAVLARRLRLFHPRVHSGRQALLTVGLGYTKSDGKFCLFEKLKSLPARSGIQPGCLLPFR